MPGRLISALIAVAVAAPFLAACTSTTSGSGQHVAISTPATTTNAAATTPTVAPSTSAAPSTTVVPAPASPLKTVSVNGSNGTVYEIALWQQRDDPSCAAHAYGQPVIAFLTAHPCYNGLNRILGTVTINGRAAGFSQSTLTIQTPGGTQNLYKNSSAFRQLLLANNTGSITDLLHDGYRLPSGPTAIPAHEAFTVLGQDSTIEIWDAWWLAGPTKDNDPVLIKAAFDTFLSF